MKSSFLLPMSILHLIRRRAPVLLGVIRLVNGVAAFFAPADTARRLGVDPAANPAPVYPLLILAGIALHWWWVPMPVRTTLGVGAFALALNLMPVAPVAIKRLLQVIDALSDLLR